METNSWTLFDFERLIDETNDSVHPINLYDEIQQLQLGEYIHFRSYKISRGKYYEVECANEYHELFHDKEQLCRFLTSKGILE